MTTTRGDDRQAALDAARTGADHGPQLTDAEIDKVERKLPPSVQVLHETVRVQGDLELARPASALAWSALAAGLSMGFSMLVPGLLHARLLDVPGVDLIAKLGYTVGFLVVILARQQLFTENTMTAVLPLMSGPGWKSLRRLLRLWSIVFAGNVIGGAVFAYGITRLPVLDAATHAAILANARELMENSTGQMFAKAIFAGWLIATMVWLVAATESSKVFLIALMTYMIGLGGFAHIVVGSIEALYLLFNGQLGWQPMVIGFLLPTLAGNIVGGSLIFALISHVQVRSDTV